MASVIITGQYRTPQNSMELGKFRDLAKNSMVCGKLWSLMTTQGQQLLSKYITMQSMPD